jgi:hypothetical protein
VLGSSQVSSDFSIFHTLFDPFIMSTIIETPFSPISGRTHFSIHDIVFKPDESHLSGATMLEPTVDSHVRGETSSPMLSKRSSIAMADSNRCSVASVSTTKSQLRHSNYLLIEMLKSIQTELSAQRSIMLDIQHRVSHLEDSSSYSNAAETPQITALKALEGRQSKRNSRLVPPEGREWWQACQNFARNSEEPISAAEFLRTPKRFSGLDWQYGMPSAELHMDTPPATPPEAPGLDDIPLLTPMSEEEHSDLDTPININVDVNLDTNIVVVSGPETNQQNIEDDIKEHTVEIDKKKLPTPPTLLPAPAGKPLSIPQQTEVVTKSMELLENPLRYYKGIKSLSTYRALLKHKVTDKEHSVLIHFHRRADLKHLEDKA